MSAIVSDLAVVNDTAESIKDVAESANYAQDRDKQGKIVTIADSHKMKSPNFNKASMGMTV